MTQTKPQDVSLYLECGARFDGQGFGDFSQPRAGEFVFCTAMSGIEESLTDPSFSGQILVSTASHVGNTGFTEEDSEAAKIWAEGLICRHLEKQPSNWRAKKTLGDWIEGEKRFVVEGIDTRQLTTLLREEGSQRGFVGVRKDWDETKAQNFIREKVPSMNGLDLTGGVSCTKPYDFSETDYGYWPFIPQREAREQPFEVAVWDFGVKTNTLRMLSALGARVRVIPATAKADEILAAGRDGILLSNGPGDPAAATHIIGELKQVLGRRPIFAICLGHQLVALASGAKTYKMKFGHRGTHHPVVEKNEQGQALRTWITSQNHGFAVDDQTLPKNAWVSFSHADDNSVEGLSLPDQICDTVQFHPEAAPGPFDSSLLMQRFFARMQRS